MFEKWGKKKKITRNFVLRLHPFLSVNPEGEFKLRHLQGIHYTEHTAKLGPMD